MRYLILGLFLAAPAFAQSTLPDPERGGALFRDSCATCHGLSARGDGPMTVVMRIAPPDLTGLTKSNDGVFPMAWVVRRIDGRDMIPSHGGPMPTFGFILDDRSGLVDDEDGNPVFTSQAVVDIAGWLELMQR